MKSACVAFLLLGIALGTLLGHGPWEPPSAIAGPEPTGLPPVFSSGATVYPNHGSVKRPKLKIREVHGDWMKCVHPDLGEVWVCPGSAVETRGIYWMTGESE